MLRGGLGELLQHIGHNYVRNIRMTINLVCRQNWGITPIDGRFIGK
jgi:hypothetical protein